MTAPFDVSIIIPTFQRREVLRRTLQLFDGQEGVAGRFEAVVVDDGSTDGAAEMLAALAPTLSYPVTVFVQPQNAGPSAARNRAMAAARGDILLITGDDILPAPDLLARHLEWHRERHPEASVGVLGHVRWALEIETTELMRWLERSGSQFAYGRIRHGDAVDHRYLYTSNVSVKRAFVEATGVLFDERLRFFEDSEWGERLEAHGFELRYNAEAVGEHLHPMSLDGSLRRMETVGRAMLDLRRVSPHAFARVTGGLFEPGARIKRALARIALHPALGRFVYAPLARFCERRLVADRVFALVHAAFMLKGLDEAMKGRRRG